MLSIFLFLCSSYNILFTYEEVQNFIPYLEEGHEEIGLNTLLCFLNTNVVDIIDDNSKIIIIFKPEIKELTDGILSLKKVHNLNLSNNNLFIISADLAMLDNLTTLNLSDNNFDEIPACLFKIVSLKELSLSNNNIKIIQDGFIIATNLETLHLTMNPIREINKNFKNSLSIKHLKLLLDLDEEQQTIIKELSIDKNGFLKKLPPNIEELTYGAYLKQLSDDFYIENLKYLDLSFNDLRDFDASFIRHRKLEMLILDFNPFFTIPKVILMLESLNYLSMKNNNLTYINLTEENIFSNLKVLNLDNNYITIFIAFRESIPKLIKINLLKNNVNDFFIDNNHDKNSIFEPSELKILYIERGNLNILPFIFNNFIGLHSFRIICRNAVDSIKPELFNNLINLIDLQELYIINSNLQEFPIEICYLTNLENLNLSYNNIISVPKELGNLKNLRMLDLSNNRLQILESSYFNCTNLRKLNLSNNAIKYFAKELLDQSSMPIVNLQYNNHYLFGDRNLLGCIDIPYYLQERFLFGPVIVNVNRIFNIYELYKKATNTYLEWDLYMLRIIKAASIPKHRLSFEEIANMFNSIAQRSNSKSCITNINQYLLMVYEKIEITIHISVIRKTTDRDKIKSYIEQIFYCLFEKTEDIDIIDNTLLMISESTSACPGGQIEHLIDIYRYLTEKIPEDLKNEVFNLLYNYKYDALKKITTSNQNLQNVHILEYWRNTLSNMIGFEHTSVASTPYYNTGLLQQKHYILYQLFKIYSIENITKKIAKHINNNPKLFSEISLILHKNYANKLNALKYFFVYEKEIEDFEWTSVTSEGVIAYLLFLGIIKTPPK